MSIQPYYERDGITIFHGDCVDVLRGLDEASIDAIVTDPPYGLEFMGKDWDKLTLSDPQAARWNGKRRPGKVDTRPAQELFKAGGARVSYGKDHVFLRCTKCGRRKFSGTPCKCDEPDWEAERPAGESYAAKMQRWHEAWAREAFRVLKPGGHLLAFGGTRTYHRMACAIEDAGFEIRDCLQWLYGSGFPKSHDVSKAIDKAVVGYHERTDLLAGRAGFRNLDGERIERGAIPLTAPATPDAERWQGWGTALKPANEPIVLARKPLSEPTVAANVLRWGTGALNVDATRVGISSGDTIYAKNPHTAAKGGGIASVGLSANLYRVPSGRWPANVILSHSLFCTDDACDPSCAVALLDAQSGERRTGGQGHRGPAAPGYDGGWRQRVPGNIPDSGGASRFYYVAKASRKERGAGNSHPTVKPVDLMRYLVRLITPPGGTVLDPFGGSGTTALACLAEGFECVLIEREQDYAQIAESRIARWSAN